MSTYLENKQPVLAESLNSLRDLLRKSDASETIHRKITNIANQY